MKIKVVTWNIGGGKILNEGDDPALLVSYSLNGMAVVAEKLKSLNPDIIAIQEAQGEGEDNQVNQLASALGMSYAQFDAVSESHIDIGSTLGHGIISRYPIINHKFEFFLNPQRRVVWEDNSIVVSHNKGITTVELDVEGQILTVQTLHLTPFRRFNLDALGKEAQPVRDDISAKITSGTSPYLLMGDFNYDDESLKAFLPLIFKNGLEEIQQFAATTPKNHKYDHILYRGLAFTDTATDSSVLTDHYPVVAEFGVEVE